MGKEDVLERFGLHGVILSASKLAHDLLLAWSHFLRERKAARTDSRSEPLPPPPEKAMSIGNGQYLPLLFPTTSDLSYLCFKETVQSFIKKRMQHYKRLIR